MALQNRIQKTGGAKNDQYYTPDSALVPIQNIIERYPRVWEPFCGQDHITRFLQGAGHSVIAHDIVNGQDFFDDTQNPPSDTYDIIVSNPPFSKKTQIIEKLYALGKPFLMLMTLGALEGIERLKLYKDNGITLFLLPRRTNYIQPTADTAKSGAWFYSCWFGHGIDGYERDRIYYL